MNGRIPEDRQLLRFAAGNTHFNGAPRSRIRTEPRDILRCGGQCTEIWIVFRVPVSLVSFGVIFVVLCDVFRNRHRCPFGLKVRVSLEAPLTFLGNIGRMSIPGSEEMA